MQKRTKVIGLVTGITLTCIIIYGCKESFIDRKPIGQYTIETYFTTEERAFQGVVGVYDVMGWNRTFAIKSSALFLLSILNKVSELFIA